MQSQAPRLKIPSPETTPPLGVWRLPSPQPRTRAYSQDTSWRAPGYLSSARDVGVGWGLLGEIRSWVVLELSVLTRLRFTPGF